MLTITADSLPRFMACNGSITMPQHRDFQPDDTVREEGNAAHWLIEQVFKKKFGTDELVERPAPNGVFISEEMIEHVTPYLEMIQGKGDVEVITSYGDGQTYQVNGRADHIWYDEASATLHVSDFKYGWSPIEPENNWTLISHVIGWNFANYLSVPTLSKAVLNIYQPRPYHPMGKLRSKTYTADELGALWGKLNAALVAPSDQLSTSTHCRKCPSRASCPAALAAGMNAIDVSEKAYPVDIDDQSLSRLLDDYERASKVIENHLKALTEMTLHRIKEGRIIPGRAVEKELTNKQWKTGVNVETAQLLTGKNLAKPQLVTPAQAVKAGVSQEVVDALCERREKGFKLVKMDAKDAVLKNFSTIINK